MLKLEWGKYVWYGNLPSAVAILLLNQIDNIPTTIKNLNPKKPMAASTGYLFIAPISPMIRLR